MPAWTTSLFRLDVSVPGLARRSSRTMPGCRGASRAATASPTTPAPTTVSPVSAIVASPSREGHPPEVAGRHTAVDPPRPRDAGPRGVDVVPDEDGDEDLVLEDETHAAVQRLLPPGQRRLRARLLD